ncbi:hypothetical protein EYM_05565 [Ignicoccus islandicus DSM 13165]|uniref:Uncharacterized protein n=1 Tax=Ignicoccus islandicus DSM 13165 TaxID=940295 RepID=A0A0U2U951_9CREN|nr:hypothetical protein [Ignicoccus islandicus]ALU12596.1 hypothetical protein EYM_05565 [Ignicoccus islandicus DSM 13165]
MGGLRCPNEIWIVNDQIKEFACYYECERNKPCIKETDVYGAEIISVMGKLYRKGNRIGAHRGSGSGVVYLKPVPGVREIRVGTSVITVKKLQFSLNVKEAYLLAPTDVTLKFEGDEGEIAFKGYLYGYPVQGSVRVPKEEVLTVLPRSEVGGFLEFETTPIYLFEFSLPKPKVPVKDMKVLEEPYLGSRVLVSVEVRPNSEFQVEAYGDLARGKSDSKGKGAVTITVKEKIGKGRVTVGLYSKEFDLPLPKEPFRMDVVEIGKRNRLNLSITSSIEAEVEVEVVGLDAPFNKKLLLKRGKNLFSLALPKLKGFSELREITVRLKYGTYECSKKLLAKISGMARVVAFDGKRLWIYSEGDLDYGQIKLMKGVNVIKPPIKNFEVKERYLIRGPFDVDEVVAVSKGKCVQVIGDSIGTFCLDGTVKFVSANGEWVLFSDGARSVIAQSPRSIGKVIEIGGNVGACAKGMPIICNESGCFRVRNGSLTKVFEGAEKIEGPFLLWKGKLYVIEGNEVREVTEADNFSYFDGKLAVLKGSVVEVEGKKFELDADEISISYDFLIALKGRTMKVYDLDGNLLYVHSQEIESAKALPNGAALSKGGELLIGEFVPDLIEEPLFVTSHTIEWSYEDLHFVTRNYQLFEEVEGCEALNEYLLPEEGFVACKVVYSDERYKPYASHLESFETVAKLFKLSRLMRRGEKLRNLFLKVLDESLPLNEIELRKLLERLRNELEEGRIELESVREIENVIRTFQKPPEGSAEVFREVLSLKNDMELGKFLSERSISAYDLIKVLSAEVKYPRKLIRDAIETVNAIKAIRGL